MVEKEWLAKKARQLGLIPFGFKCWGVLDSFFYFDFC
jgi:hypothetical protein